MGLNEGATRLTDLPGSRDVRGVSLAFVKMKFTRACVRNAGAPVTTARRVLNDEVFLKPAWAVAEGFDNRCLPPEREIPMLVLSRKLGEKIVIGDNIVVTVVKIDRNQIRLGIEAPHEVPVYREEISPNRVNKPVGDEAALSR